MAPQLACLLAYKHTHTRAGLRANRLKRSKGRGQGGAAGIALLCWKRPGANSKPWFWQHQPFSSPSRHGGCPAACLKGQELASGTTGRQEFVESSLEPQIKFRAGEQLPFSARPTQGRPQGGGQRGPNETERPSPHCQGPWETPPELGSGRENTEGAGVGVGCTVPFVQTPVLSVKNNRSGDKIGLSLTPAILGVLIFKPQNEPWAWGEGRGPWRGQEATLSHSPRYSALLVLEGDKVRVGSGSQGSWLCPRRVRNS